MYSSSIPSSQYTYQIYGLTVTSNQPIPGLPEGPVKGKIDITLIVQPDPANLSQFDRNTEVLHHTNVDLDVWGNTMMRVWKASDGSYFRFQFGDGATFLIDKTASHIWITWPSTLTQAEVFSYIYSTIFSNILHLHDVFALHGCVISIEGLAIGILGNSGAGKSTLAASFAQQGYQVLSDDLVALTKDHQEFVVQPGYSYIKLWPPSVSTLYGSEDALPRILPDAKYWVDWDKRFLDIRQNGYFDTQSRPLRALYLLNSRDPAIHTPVFESLSASASFRKLGRHTLVIAILNTQTRINEFEMIVELIDQIPIRQVTPPDNLTLLPLLSKHIREDVHHILKARVS